MHRRTFLSILAAGASAFALNACAAHSGPQPVPSTPDAAFPTRTLVPAPAPTLVPTLAPAPVVAVPNLVQVSIPEGVMTALPGTGKLLAWTVDDGSNSDVVRLYTQFGPKFPRPDRLHRRHGHTPPSIRASSADRHSARCCAPNVHAARVARVGRCRACRCQCQCQCQRLRRQPRSHPLRNRHRCRCSTRRPRRCRCWKWEWSVATTRTRTRR